MENFRLRIDDKHNVIIVEYSGTVSYRTLLDSLTELCDLGRSEPAHIVLDFSTVESFFIRYRHIINFRHALKALFPHTTVGKIAVINPRIFQDLANLFHLSSY